MKYKIFDDFANPESLEEVLKEWPEDGWKFVKWDDYETDGWVKEKASIKNPAQFGPITLSIIHELHSPEFVQWLEQQTGIPNLHPDPYLEGGGLHYVKPGGYLNTHIDFNFHNKLNMVRRVNLLLYLNKEPEGGELELLDGDDKIMIEPKFNRCVIFNTTEDSWHGHPNPTKTDRKSIALYYYSPGNVDEIHTTIYR